MSNAEVYPHTPDGRYFVVRERLWRLSNPRLPEAERTALVKDLMQARSALRHADESQKKSIRMRIDQAKTALGERGPVWWQDGSPDFNRHLIKNTPYREWWRTRRASA